VRMEPHYWLGWLSYAVGVAAGGAGGSPAACAADDWGHPVTADALAVIAVGMGVFFLIAWLDRGPRRKL